MSRIVEALERLCEDNNLSVTLPKEIIDFMNMPTNMDFIKQYSITKDAVNVYFKELKSIEAKENSWEYLDTIYDEKRNFYKKYVDFAKKCREMSDINGVTGYGRFDFIQIKIMDLCKTVDYNFPYGWK